MDARNPTRKHEVGGTRGNTGRGSAGARVGRRRLDRADVLARRAQLLAQAASPERSRELTTIRRQLASIDNRQEEV